MRGFPSPPPPAPQNDWKGSSGPAATAPRPPAAALFAVDTQPRMASPNGWETLKAHLRLCHSAIETGLAELAAEAEAGGPSQSPEAPAVLTPSHFCAPPVPNAGPRSARSVDAHHYTRMPLREGAGPPGNEDSKHPPVPLRDRVHQELRRAEALSETMRSLCQGDPLRALQLRQLERVTQGYLAEFKVAESHASRAKAAASPRRTLHGGVTALPQEHRLLLRETSALHSSVTLLDDTLAIGREATASLNRQGQTLHNAKSTLGRFMHRLPRVRTVLNAIQRVKRRNAVVLASVVAFCVFLCWLYAGR